MVLRDDFAKVAKTVPFDKIDDVLNQQTFNASNVQDALMELRQHISYDSETTATTTSGTKTLTSASVNVQFFTGTAAGYAVDLPDATTLFLSAQYHLINTSSQTIDIKDGAGNFLFTLSQNSIGYVTLQLNGTIAGTWVWYQTTVSTATGIVNYNVISSTPFTTSSTTDVLITGFTVTPQAGTYAIWFAADSTITANNALATYTVYKGGSAVTDSKRTIQGSSSNFKSQMNTLTITQFNGSQAADVRVSITSSSLTINQRSLLLIRLGT